MHVHVGTPEGCLGVCKLWVCREQLPSSPRAAAAAEELLVGQWQLLEADDQAAAATGKLAGGPWRLLGSWRLACHGQRLGRVAAAMSW